MTLREWITTLLDLAALLLVAFGAGAAVFPLIGWASVAVAGLVIGAWSRVIVWIATPSSAPAWWKKLQAGERR
ncbi:hypothetical protein SK571_13550 [Lentzea sp. BCCO 10_0798]|uniref:Uncharacterized protein n=1 Tax=Lentzea kristufekii TaxID=3095430 RepID=A0ABU4TQ62_9PSEU|nr:hypothetical protein [Lentzea sp. BCCO 10_0798]MDX8050411.1 hypothetical protein [Lentzea sp. BCCO 10_0798]